MSNDIQYVVKQVINLSKEHKIIALSCLSNADIKEKNNNFKKISAWLSTAGMDFITVNYDKSYRGYVDVDATDICTDLSYNFNEIDIKSSSFVLVNMNPIIGFESMLDKDSGMSKVILNVKYGRTSFEAIEQCTALLKSNNMEVIGVIANNR